MLTPFTEELWDHEAAGLAAVSGAPEGDVVPVVFPQADNEPSTRAAPNTRAITFRFITHSFQHAEHQAACRITLEGSKVRARVRRHSPGCTNMILR